MKQSSSVLANRTGEPASPDMEMSLLRPSGRRRRRVYILSFAFLALLITGFVGLGLWTWFGSLEESVPGVGQLVPQGKIRRVMSPMNGVVSKMLVEENQSVKAGQVLLILDPEQTEVQQEGVEEQLALLQSEANALRVAATLDGKSRLNVGYGQIQDAWLVATLQAYQAQQAEAEIAIREAEHNYNEQVQRYKQVQDVLRTTQQLMQNYRQLYQEGGLSAKDLYEYEQRLDQQRGELAARSEAKEAARLMLEQARHKPVEIAGTFNREILSRLSEREQKIAELKTNVQQVRLALARQTITAPVDGVINEQSIRGPGEVVTAGQPIMTIVPKDSTLVAEVRVANRDLAYIHLNQRAALHLDAFPYQHFGRLFGTVTAISPSTQQGTVPSASQEVNTSLEHDQRPYYVLTIKPDKNVMSYKDTQYPLRSGMTLSADIITRKKNILSFFTEPIHFQLDRAFRDPTNR